MGPIVFCSFVYPGFAFAPGAAPFAVSLDELEGALVPVQHRGW